MKVPRAITKVIEGFERLPGIGPKTAARLTYYMLYMPTEKVEEFARALVGLTRDVSKCSVCMNIGDSDPCDICTDSQRDQKTICVVEQPLDVLALERTGKFQGVYHVLHGVIAPLQQIGPEEIYINQLLKRIMDPESKIAEVVLALNPTMEGEATAMYIKQQIRNSKFEIRNLRVTRLAQGLPLGGDVEYADEVTLGRAMEGRREY